MMTDEYLCQVPEEFAEEVRQALTQLYNFPFLQQLSLGHRIRLKGNGGSTGAVLRRELIHAIESINPGHHVPNQAAEARIYQLINLHYVGRMTIKEVALQLDISERQAYRDLKRGQNSVIAFLWAMTEEVSPEADASVESELTRLKDYIQTTDLIELLEISLAAVSRQAAQKDIHFVERWDRESVVVSTNAPVARQVLIQLLSHAVRSSLPQPIEMDLQSSATSIIFRLQYTVMPDSDAQFPGIIQHLVDQLDWRMTLSTQGQTSCIAVEINTQKAKILIIDDNEGIAELIKRYLADYNFQLFSAASGQQGLSMAQQLHPDIILLDVMMPGMDGWEFLQRLKTYPGAAEIPVVICSFLNNPELAYSLGAVECIAKPVTQHDLLDLLAKLDLI